MRIPQRLSRGLSFVLLAQMVLAPSARALGPLTPVNLEMTRAAPTMNDREGTLDYPVTFRNTTAQTIAGPIQVLVPSDLQNWTLFTPYDPNQDPPQKHYVTLPTSLAPGASFTQIFRLAPSRLTSPVFTPFVESIGPVDPATAPAPQFANGPRAYVVQSDWPSRIRAFAGQEFVWDAEATNPNGGTLAFSLGALQNSKPDLVGAAPLTGATLDPQTGVLRWTPPAPGLYTARLTVADGKANATGTYDLAFLVENVNAQPPALSCSGYSTTVSQPGGETPLYYDFRGWDDRYLLGANPQNVVVGPGRTAACTPYQGATVGEGSHTVRCATTDALWPNSSCEFPASVYPGYPFVVIDAQDYVNLRLVTADCVPTNALTPCTLPGTTDVTVRNTGLGVAHDVVLTIPIPPEANSEAISVVTAGTSSLCNRVVNGSDVSLVCTLGDLAGGAENRVAWVLAPSGTAFIYSPEIVSVTTSTPELTYADNAVVSQPRIDDIFSSGGYVTDIFVCSAIFPDTECHCEQGPTGVIDVPGCKLKAAQAWAEYKAEEECRREHAHDHALASLLGDACEKKPAWFTYVINGIMAVGTIAIGAGVVLEAAYGAANLSIFASDLIPAAAYPIN